METIKKHWALFQFIRATRDMKTIQCVVKSLNKSQAKFFSELALNVYKGKVPINNYYKKTVRNHKSFIVQWAEGTNRSSLISNPEVVRLLTASSLKKNILKPVV